MTPLIRRVGDDEEERLAFARAVSRHFFEDEPDDDLRAMLPVLAASRSWVATDGDRFVANWSAMPVDVSVPGGRPLPCAAITAVGVSQTSRRRGLLRALMAAGLDEAREHDEPVAALYASESAIYPRFGFGIAAPSRSYRVDSANLRFLDPVDPTQVVDLDPEASVREARVVHALVRAQRGGGVDRLPAHWELAVAADPASARQGGSSKRRVHVPGRGYAIYRVHDGPADTLPNGHVAVQELVAADPEAEQALWQHLASVDLTTSVHAALRPPDDPLTWMVEDRLRLRATESAPLYVRLLDVPRCLASRTSAVTDGLVLEVHDGDRDQSGTYRWDVSPEGSACTRTEAPADLALSIEVLAACWLGGNRPSHLRAARRIEERTPGATVRLDHMTAVPHAPWTPWEF